MIITNDYIKSLKNSLYKCLCLFEEKNEGLPQFIDSLSYEIYGLHYLVENDKKPLVTSILCILEHFYDESILQDYDLKQIRREVFHCMDLIEKSYKVGV